MQDTIILNKEAQGEMSDEELIALMKSGSASQFWCKILEIMKENVRVLEMQIIDKVDIRDNPLNDQEVDQLRDRRDSMMDLMNTPDLVITSLQREDPHEEELDPYAQHKKADSSI